MNPKRITTPTEPVTLAEAKLHLRGVDEPGFDAESANRAFPRSMELQVLKNRTGASGDRIAFEYYPAYNFFREQ